jgi:UDP-N-acetylmuramate--alanine ligase
LSLLINGKHCALHFSGILGSGMSAVGNRIAVSGSDRLAASEDMQEIKKKLEDAGCFFFPQDGSAMKKGPDALVVSTAIEETNPDVLEARRLRIPIVHRSDVLAAIASEKRTIAIAGTSGKSTVSAMVFEILTKCKKNPSLITGANLNYLEEKGLFGNAFCAASDILVIEADESDGSLVKYKPYLSVFLNLSKDHKPVAEVLDLFRTLARNSKHVIANAGDPALDLPSPKTTFGRGQNADFHPDSVETITPSIHFLLHRVTVDLPLPGQHNLENALAALLACTLFDCDMAQCAEALQGYRGVKRRFSITKLPSGITVIDDFAHNPEKVKAAVTTAQSMSQRVLAIFQPHGFGPTRFLKDDFVTAFSTTLRETDELFLLPIYYAGGTALKDISSDDLALLIQASHLRAAAPKSRDECLSKILQKATAGDAILLMGARDPSLPAFAREIAESLRTISHHP